MKAQCSPLPSAVPDVPESVFCGFDFSREYTLCYPTGGCSQAKKDWRGNLSLPPQGHLLLASSGDFLSAEKSLPLSEQACAAMRSRRTASSCVGLSDCTAQCINYEPNHQTSSLTGLPFLLGYQVHSTETTERKSEDQDTMTGGSQLVTSDFIHPHPTSMIKWEKNLHFLVKTEVIHKASDSYISSVKNSFKVTKVSFHSKSNMGSLEKKYRIETNKLKKIKVIIPPSN